MPTSKVDLILHPHRLRIIEALAGSPLTTQEIADRLTDIPKSSIYRHLKTLLDAGIITVAETRPVKGVEEKVYRIEQQPDLGPQDLAGLTPDDHLRYFAAFLGSLLHNFEDYLRRTPHPDLLADIVGYREAVFYVTDDEFIELATKLNQLFLTLTHPTPPPRGPQHPFTPLPLP